MLIGTVVTILIKYTSKLTDPVKVVAAFAASLSRRVPVIVIVYVPKSVEEEVEIYILSLAETRVAQDGVAEDTLSVIEYDKLYLVYQSLYVVQVKAE